MALSHLEETIYRSFVDTRVKIDLQAYYYVGYLIKMFYSGHKLI